MELQLMKNSLPLLMLLALATGCTSPLEDAGNTDVAKPKMQSVSIGERKIALDQCKLYAETAAGPVALYEFKDHERCYFMEFEGKVRVFQSESGTVIPVGIPLQTRDDCETSAYAVVYRDDSFYLSSKYYSRFQCKDFNWPEKPFHVLASEAIRLPSDGIAFEEAN